MPKTALRRKPRTRSSSSRTPRYGPPVPVVTRKVWVLGCEPTRLETAVAYLTKAGHQARGGEPGREVEGLGYASLMGETTEGPGTSAVHGGERPDPATGSLTTPVYRTSTFRFATTEDLLAGARGERPGFYTRYGHPNFEVVEKKFALLHRAEDAVLFASGLGALAGILQGLLRPGDRVVCLNDVYGGTRALLSDLKA